MNSRIKSSSFSLFKNFLSYNKASTHLLYQIPSVDFSSKFSIMQMKEKQKAKKKLREQESQIINEKMQKKQQGDKSKEIDPRKKIFATPMDALAELRKYPQRFSNQMINMTVSLNIDPKKGNQVVRGIYKMPGGSNKIPKILVFTSAPLHDIAKNAGADMIADAQTYKNIQEGVIDFDKTVCTLDVLPTMKNLGRILGPKGLMPSVKVGTACTADNLEKIIKELKLGSKEFKTDIWGQTCVPIGRFDFTEEKILLNIDSFMKVLLEKKPEVVKGRYFLYSFISTHRHSFRLDMRSLDPKSSMYFKNKME